MLIAYLIFVNLIAIALYGYDKSCAKKRMWRVSERTLLTSALIGGSIGAYLGMLYFRHKTNHKIFQIIIPSAVVIQTVIFLIIY